ncbi:MAG: phosphoribosyltransferase [Nostoc sp.]
MEETLVAFAKCFRKKYLKNLIVRHTTSRKSAYARSSGEIIDHLNQLNTIYINKLPSYGDNNIYTNPPLKKGKTILLLDDFCTQGYSLEAARIFIEKTGANVICLSLLKTIIKDYEQIVSIENFNPFQPNQFSSPGSVFRHSYNKYVLNSSAHEEIGSKLQAYDNWQWLNGI